MSSEMSRSYPYAWISRRHGLDYGTVLCYADAIDKEASAWNRHEAAAVDLVDCLPPEKLEPLDEDLTRARALWQIARSRGMAAALTEVLP